MSQSKLKDLLAKFLKGEEIGKYPVIETRILSLSPLQITDDYQKFIDVSSLEDRITEELNGKLSKSHKLILQDWKFILRRIPNSHEYFFDLSVNKYKLQEDGVMMKPEHEPIKMEDDVEIRYLFETRKRQEIEKMVRAKENPIKSEDLGDKSASKNTVTKEEPVTAIPSQKITENKETMGSLTNEEFKKTLFSKPSATKTEDRRSPVYLDSSFFRKAGVISTATKFKPEDLLFLTIAELMSVAPFIPQVKRSVIRAMPPIRMRRSPSSESGGEEFHRESSSRMVQRYSVDRESRVRHQNLDFEDIHEYIRSGVINWNQLVFNRSAFDYLQKNKRMLEFTE